MTAWHYNRLAQPANASIGLRSGGLKTGWADTQPGEVRAAPPAEPSFARGALIGLALVVPFWSAAALGLWWLLR